MLSVYCLNADCAQPNYYSLVKPSICGFCGSRLDGLTVATKKTPKKVIAKEIEDVDDEDVTDTTPHKTLKQKNIERFKNRRLGVEEDDGATVPDIEKLEFEIVGTRQKLTLEEIGKQSKAGFIARPVDSISKEETIRIFREEAKGKSKPIELDDSQEE